jgi:hypothetical protein
MAPSEQSGVPTDDEISASERWLLEFFSDRKKRIPPRKRWLFDPERQQFVRDPIDLMINQAIDEVFGTKDQDADLDQPRPLPPDKPR